MAVEHSLKDLMAYFSTPDRPVSAAEFQAFWKTCDDQEKAYYKSAPLT